MLHRDTRYITAASKAGEAAGEVPRGGQAARAIAAALGCLLVGSCAHATGSKAKAEAPLVKKTAAQAGAGKATITKACPGRPGLQMVNLPPGKAKHVRSKSGRASKQLPMISFKPSFDPAKGITVAGVGDILLHDSLQKRAAKTPAGFSDLWADIVDILKAADVTYGNLEGPAARDVAPNGRAVKKSPKSRHDGYVYGGYPQFNYHPQVATALKDGGFDVVSTANNHSLDRHALGVDRTLEALSAAGLAATGTRHRKTPSQSWYAITPVTKNGRTYKIAWLACTYGTNDIRDRHKQVLHCYKKQGELLKEIALLASRTDISAVMFAPHWGLEYRHKPTKRQRALAHAAIEAGATAVIGSHPHVMQPWERYVTAQGREALIIYSLGNFVSGQLGVPRRSSVIALLGLMPDAKEPRKLAIASVGFVPIRMHLQASRKGVRIAAEAIDRVKRGYENKRHILKHLPPGNLHPPASPFWQVASCPAKKRG